MPPVFGAFSSPKNHIHIIDSQFSVGHLGWGVRQHRRGEGGKGEKPREGAVIPMFFVSFVN